MERENFVDYRVVSAKTSQKLAKTAHISPIILFNFTCNISNESQWSGLSIESLNM
jgi:hypothetical protein